MKVRFICNNRYYLAPTIMEAKKFIAFWREMDYPHSIKRIHTGWHIKGIELAPGWAPVPLILDKIEFA